MSSLPEILSLLASAKIVKGGLTTTVIQQQGNQVVATRKTYGRLAINQAIPAAGATVDIVQGLIKGEGQRRIIGGSLSLSGGAARNTQVGVKPKSPNVFLPLSDSAAGLLSVTSDIYLDADDVLQLIVDAAADSTVLLGYLTVEDELVVT